MRCCVSLYVLVRCCCGVLRFECDLLRAVVCCCALLCVAVWRFTLLYGLYVVFRVVAIGCVSLCVVVLLLCCCWLYAAVVYDCDLLCDNLVVLCVFGGVLLCVVVWGCVLVYVGLCCCVLFCVGAVCTLLCFMLCVFCLL